MNAVPLQASDTRDDTSGHTRVKAESFTRAGDICRGTSLITRNSAPLGHYSRTMPTGLRWS
jgi:hypothetical protein